jgi:cytochrome c2
LKPETALVALAAAVAAAFVFAGALAQDAGGALVSGPGAGLTQAKCQICHEIGHVTRSRLSRGEWADNLRNMRERGAPINDEEFEIILNYLAAYYGRDPAPPPAPDTLAAGARGDAIAGLLQAHACSACHAAGAWSDRRSAKWRSATQAIRAPPRASLRRSETGARALGARCRCHRRPQSRTRIWRSWSSGCWRRNRARCGRPLAAAAAL